MYIRTYTSCDFEPGVSWDHRAGTLKKKVSPLGKYINFVHKNHLISKCYNNKGKSNQDFRKM